MGSASHRGYELSSLPTAIAYQFDTYIPWSFNLHSGIISGMPSVPPIPADNQSLATPEVSSPLSSVKKSRNSGRRRVKEKREGDRRLIELFARNMRLVRISRELTQEQLADLCEIDRTYISGLERTIRNPALKNIQRIADELNVDVRVLFDPDLDEAAANTLYGATGKNAGAR
ncbi:helix-turn-helix transcriptional regulator [Rhodoferax sp. GW822-FHT02A01]|uniref:helix-turn-helix domain-containing protein n=1 Tax=Rhodoferax sp. GW822-FHT02A01 TaxID=3141537 RepID=UPI00315CF464